MFPFFILPETPTPGAAKHGLSGRVPSVSWLRLEKIMLTWPKHMGWAKSCTWSYWKKMIVLFYWIHFCFCFCQKTMHSIWFHPNHGKEHRHLPEELQQRNAAEVGSGAVLSGDFTKKMDLFKAGLDFINNIYIYTYYIIYIIFYIIYLYIHIWWLCLMEFGGDQATIDTKRLVLDGFGGFHQQKWGYHGIYTTGYCI